MLKTSISEELITRYAYKTHHTSDQIRRPHIPLQDGASLRRYLSNSIPSTKSCEGSSRYPSIYIAFGRAVRDVSGMLNGRRQRRAREGVLEPSAERRTQSRTRWIPLPAIVLASTKAMHGTRRRVARSSASSSDSGVPYEDFAPTRRRSRYPREPSPSLQSAHARARCAPSRRCILTTPQPPGPEVVTPAASSPPWASALNTAPLPLRTSQILVAIYGKLPSGLHLCIGTVAMRSLPRSKMARTALTTC